MLSLEVGVFLFRGDEVRCGNYVLFVPTEKMELKFTLRGCSQSIMSIQFDQNVSHPVSHPHMVDHTPSSPVISAVKCWQLRTTVGQEFGPFTKNVQRLVL